MELALFVYLSGVIGSVKEILMIICILTAIFVMSYIIITYFEGDYKVTALFRNIVIALFVVGTITTLIPSEKTMYLMLAGYTAQSTVQSETAGKVLKIIDNKLEEYLKEIPNK